jgi:hypothetical protein
MNRQELFAIWAPAQSIWSKWAKGVVFSHFEGIQEPELSGENLAFDLSWVKSERSTALVLDLPGAVGVRCGVLLAAEGFRPVPLYKAIPVSPGRRGPIVPALLQRGISYSVEVVDISSVLQALAGSAEQLWNTKIPPDAPPAFLLDSRRRVGDGPVFPGRFDNRSVSFSSDFPSAAFLANQGIRRVVLVNQRELEPQADLAHTLLRWQKEGLEILSRPLEGAGQAVAIQIRRPSMFNNLWLRVSAVLGLRRNPLGGFGRDVPLYGAGG